MKKLMWTAAAVALIAGCAAAATITVTQPAQGATWTKGQTKTIAWTKSGAQPATVRIVLRNQANTGVVKVLNESAPNSGSYQWTVPNDVADGSYHVRVRADEATFGDSGMFAVASAAPQPTGSITVTKPAEGDRWLRPLKHTIQWTKSGSLPANVTIILMPPNGSTAVRTIVGSTPNSGAYEWTMPSDLPSGDYRVRVQALKYGGGGTFDDGGRFTVASMAQALPGGAELAMDVTKQATEVKTIFRVITDASGLPSSGYIGRPTGFPPAQAYGRYPQVGFDRFTVMDPNVGTGPAPRWVTTVYRGGFKFDLAALQGRGDRLKSAKVRFKQVGSLISGVANASCGMRMYRLLAPLGDGGDPQIVTESGLIFTSTDYTIDVKDTVRKWLNGVVPNHGFYVVSPEVDYGTQAQTCISTFEVTLTLEFF